MPERAVYTVAELAELIGLSANGVYEALKRREIPHLKVGGRYILPRAMIDAWLKGSDPEATIDFDARNVTKLVEKRGPHSVGRYRRAGNPSQRA